MDVAGKGPAPAKYLAFGIFNLHQRLPAPSRRSSCRFAVPYRIEERAYQIWEDEGCPTGCELDHWLRAESEITEAVPELEMAEGAGSKKKS